jgi:hypothetical protein
MKPNVSGNSLFKYNTVFLGLLMGFVSSSVSSENPLIFSSSALTNNYCQQLLSKGIITKANPVSCERLRRIEFSYLDENSKVKEDGELVVLDVLAPKVVALTKKLLEQKFVVFKAKPIEDYQGDDQLSMADNNSSAFNGRAITGGSSWSLHAYGAAIDINPIQNPFIDIDADGTAHISPIKSARYAVNRSNQRPGKLPRPGLAEEVVDTFAQYGFFIWGGDWNYPIDYQHFQVGPRSFVGTLVAMEPHNAEVLLDKYISMYLNCKQRRQFKLKPKQVRAECVAVVIAEMR